MNKFVASLVAISTLGVSLALAESITIGTGELRGVYHPVGNAICKIMNKNTNLQCATESTRGSSYNIHLIKSGDFDFGISHGDVAYQSYKGEERFKGEQIPELRSVMAIYPELLALVVAKNSGIQIFEDIKGKRINTDYKYSGTSETTNIIFDAFGIKRSDMSASDFKSTECPTLLQENKLDGYFYMTGQPTANLRDAANFSEVNIIPIEGAPVNKLIQKHPYYIKGVIPGTFYKGVSSDVPTFGVKAILLTNAKVKDDVVYQVTKTILDNFDEFKKLHSVLKSPLITKESLLDGLGVPQHPGAIRAFREAGLLK